MKTENLNDLYIQELEDLLSAENQLVKALPKIIEAASTPELQDAIKAHLEQTKRHVERIQQVMEMADQTPSEKECQAMKGLLKEGDEIIEEIGEGALRDAALIGACQRVEHYEIAAYGTTRAFAQLLGYADQYNLLSETLDEETAADEKLTEVADSTVNPAANEIGDSKSGSSEADSQREGALQNSL